jgi:putative endonuclease
MGRENKELGSSGEDIACRFLRSKGYRILGTNQRTPFGELDVIAKKDGYTIFIEVKTRASSSLGPPYLNVTRKKKRHIIKNALCYLKQHGLIDSFWRVDVISIKVDLALGSVEIELFENAIEEGDY